MESQDLGFSPRVNVPRVNMPHVNIPNVLLITHPHNDHIKELPILLSKARQR